MSNLPEVLIQKIFNYAFYPHQMPFCKTQRYNKVIENLPIVEMNYGLYRIYHWYCDYYPNYNYSKLRKQHLTALRIMRNVPKKPYMIFSYVLRRFKNKALVEIDETTNHLLEDGNLYNPLYFEKAYKSYLKEKKTICKDFLFEDDY